MQATRDRLVAHGLTFTQARADDATCAPGRASLHTGNLSTNHGIGAGNTIDDYYDFYRWGARRAPGIGKATRWIGPWEFDLAKMAGLPDTPVVPVGSGAGTQQTLLGVGSAVTNNPTWDPTNVVGHGNTRESRSKLGDITTPDDLQAFTGSIANWLNQAGVTCGLVGKYQNSYAKCGDDRYTTADQQYLFVPPGWDYWYALIGDDESPTPDSHGVLQYAGGAQDHWRVHANHFEGTNPGDGWGAVGTEVAFRYDLPISSITWAGGTATVTVDSSLNRPTNLSIGDEVHIEGVTPTGFCSTVGQAGFTVTAILSDYSFQYALSNPGASSGSSAVGSIMTAYPRPNYGDAVWARKAVEFINTRDEAEPWYLYIAPDNPHQGTSSGDTPSDARERERRYTNTVDPNGFQWWNGVHGALSPATLSGSLTSGRLAQWQQRQEMIASTDDLIDEVMAACEARGWTNVIVVFTSDNGFQVGEQEAREGTVVWDSLGGKGFVYDGSVRIPFVIRHPRWASGQTTDMLVYQADVPLTVLDWFGLTTHHAHTKRDGYSIQRLLANRADPVNNRAQLITRGDYYQGACEAIIDKTLMKFIRVRQNTAVYELWDRTTDVDYEMTNIASANPTVVATLNARLAALRDARWTGTTNTCRTS